MVLLKERIGKMLEYLKDQIYPEKMEIKNYKMIRTDEKFQDVAHLPGRIFRMSRSGVVIGSIIGLRLS